MRKIKLSTKQKNLLIGVAILFILGIIFSFTKLFILEVEATEITTTSDKQEYKTYREQREKEDVDFAKLAKEKTIKMKEVLEEIRKIENLKADTGLNVVGYQQKDIIISHYGDTYAQNGGYPNITCTGAKLADGMVASNVYPLGTKFYWNGKVYTVADKGGSHFDRYDRLDVFVPRYKGESDSAYIKRIYKYGKKTVKTYILEIGDGTVE